MKKTLAVFEKDETAGEIYSFFKLCFTLISRSNLNSLKILSSLSIIACEHDGQTIAEELSSIIGSKKAYQRFLAHDFVVAKREEFCGLEKNDLGISISHLAAKRGDTFVLSKLLKFSTESGIYDDVDILGRSPLHYAATYSKRTSIELILSNKEHRLEILNKQDIYGVTALHESCVINNVPVARNLLKFGASMYIEDAHGRTALGQAVELGYCSMVSLFSEFGVSMESRSHGKPVAVVAYESGHQNLAIFMIKDGYSVVSKYDTDEAQETTFIHELSKNKKATKVFKVIIETYYSKQLIKLLSAVDGDDRTPEEVAKIYNNKKFIKQASKVVDELDEYPVEEHTQDVIKHDIDEVSMLGAEENS